MNELVKIGEHEIAAKMYKSQRVVTFKDIDMVHERPEGTARHRFASNKERFIEGVDYFVITPKTLENTELDAERPIGIEAVSQRGTVLITETGYLMLVKSLTDDLSWKVQRNLVSSYFRIKEVVNQEVSPELQMLQGLLNQMVKKELEDKERDRLIAEAQATANRAVETNERIKEEFITPFDNWRDDVNSKIREIAVKAGIPYQNLFGEMYRELESKAGCDLATRQRNKQERMRNSGCRKTDIDKETTKIAIIGDDKKLKQIFDDIVRRYAVKYVA